MYIAISHFIFVFKIKYILTQNLYNLFSSWKSEIVFLSLFVFSLFLYFLHSFIVVNRGTLSIAATNNSCIIILYVFVLSPIAGSLFSPCLLLSLLVYEAIMGTNFPFVTNYKTSCAYMVIISYCPHVSLNRNMKPMWFSTYEKQKGWNWNKNNIRHWHLV